MALVDRRPLAIGLFTSLSSGCVVGGGGGYGYDGNVGVGLDYYEPAGVEYSGRGAWLSCCAVPRWWRPSHRSR